MKDIREILLRDGIIHHGNAEITPLIGGISSEIYCVKDAEHVFVVKRALEKLKVADDWFADLSRNSSEVEFLRCVHLLIPEAVPLVEFVSAEHGYFTMEFLGDGFDNWKTLLLNGTSNPEHARRAAQVLAKIHGGTWGNLDICARFETTKNFHELRLDPYLSTTGRRHPDLESHFTKEIDRIKLTRLCLIHGDYSPKNMLLSGNRLVVLDCEVAWFGDPTFDVAFLLNHFFLKSLHCLDRRRYFFQLIRLFWETYRAELGPDRAAHISLFLPRLILMLMLARVDGKSPVEYLRGDERKKSLIRGFARERIPIPPIDMATLVSDWDDVLCKYNEN